MAVTYLKITTKCYSIIYKQGAPLKGVLLNDFRYFSLFLRLLFKGGVTTEKSTTEMYGYLTLSEYL